MGNQLADKLIWMNQEVLALKTAHEHGIGLMLYRRDVSVTGDGDTWRTYVVTTTIPNSATAYPMLEAYGNKDALPTGVVVSDGGRTFKHYFSIGSDEEEIISVISTSPISSCVGAWA